MICPTIPLLAASVGLYQLTDLGSITFPHSLANDINANGLIVGQALQEAPGLESRAVVWSEGVPTDMGTLGGTQSTALRVNDANQVVGWSYVNADAYYRGFIWSDGAVTELGTLGGASSGASGINQTGEVVGWSFLSDEWTTHGFVWRGGPLEDLGRLSTDYRNTMAFDLNDSGRVVGYAYKLMPQYASKAVLWDDGAIAELDDLGGTQALAYSVNTAGTIVGWSNLPGDESAHATLWTDVEGVVDLGVLGGNYTNSSAVAIAANGTVVGASSDPDVVEDSRAVIWVDREIEDLNELVSNGEDWLLTAAYAVAENGAIVGLAATAGDLLHAVLLTPETSVVGDGPPVAPAAAHARILPNHPNPFNPRTTIPIELDEEARVRLAVYDLRGGLIRVLVDERLPAGRHSVRWDGRGDAGQGVAAGSYVVRLSARGDETKRWITMIK